ncbi:hypothetical protein ACQP2T_63605 (plasmid) [Nonomuraea sp. CA-143628]|uniref:hypothetical protein n=1 Tax=Nonomuraea sp. CA-143628 TaxID=3239997 RepID=UPI003D8A50E1
MTWPERLLEYATLAALVVVALVVTFCAEDAASFRTRLWSTHCRWTWAAWDTTKTSTVLSKRVTVTSTRETALRLLRDVIGDL